MRHVWRPSEQQARALARIGNAAAPRVRRQQPLSKASHLLGPLPVLRVTRLPASELARSAFARRGALQTAGRRWRRAAHASYECGAYGESQIRKPSAAEAHDSTASA
eukprot:4282434-Prymnesium_polylepis.1